MATDTMATTISNEKNEAPSNFNREQTSKAVRALLKHMKTHQEENARKSDKRQLFPKNGMKDADGKEDDEEPDDLDMFVWLILATKKHIKDQKRLQPSRLSVPHSLNTSPSSTICLITATPQRAFKDVIAHASFPAELRSRITRVIDLTKLQAKYKSFESRRQLAREHDIFLADDRVKLSLPHTLGKVFYKTTTKRPIPVVLSAKKRKEEEGSRRKVTPLKPGEKSVAAPIPMANEITRALSSVLVHISPSTSTAVRVGRAGWNEKKVVENVEAVVQGMVEKFVPRKWQNVKSLHIKGPNTIGLPLWMSDELWVDEQDVVEDPPEPEPKDANDDGRERSKRKRKRRKQETANGEPKKLTEHADAGDGEVDDEVAKARQRIKKQKMEAMGDLEGDAVLARPSKRRSKAVEVT